jgi:ABC-type amino acid transport substrate-binding protein
MKKSLVVAMVCLLVSAFTVTAFAGAATLPASEKQAKTVGMLRMEQTSEDTISRDTAQQIRRNRKIVFYDSLQPLVRDLYQGRLDRVALPEFTVDYLRGRDAREKLLLSVQHSSRYFSAFSLATYNNIPLRDKLNQALAGMDKDGTTAKLVKIYVTGLPGDVDPARVALPRLSGKPTVKVAVTGALPPLDYLTPEGQPAGFNVLFLSEVGKRAGLNIQFVNADVRTAFEKLKAHEVDVLFAYSVTTVVANNAIRSTYDAGQDPAVNLTQAYLEVPVRLLKLK